MAKKLLSVFVALTMLTPTLALAEETPEPDYVVLPVEAGDVVPFDGEERPARSRNGDTLAHPQYGSG